jgi:hypothetical protein
VRLVRSPPLFWRALVSGLAGLVCVVCLVGLVDLVGLVLPACVPSEPTTALGYVVAPSSPPSDAGLLDADGAGARYSSAAAESDARR